MFDRIRFGSDHYAPVVLPVSPDGQSVEAFTVQPGETAGGHTVYVLPEDTVIFSVRWSSRPETDLNTLVWTIDD